MKRNLSFLFIFLFTACFFSQKISINWEGSKIRDFGEVKLNLPSFSNPGFSFDQNNIFINIKHSAGEKDL